MPHVHGAGGRHGGRQAKLVVYARVLGVAAAVGSLVQATFLPLVFADYHIRAIDSHKLFIQHN